MKDEKLRKHIVRVILTRYPSPSSPISDLRSPISDLRSLIPYLSSLISHPGVFLVEPRGEQLGEGVQGVLRTRTGGLEDQLLTLPRPERGHLEDVVGPGPLSIHHDLDFRRKGPHEVEHHQRSPQVHS